MLTLEDYLSLKLKMVSRFIWHSQSHNYCIFHQVSLYLSLCLSLCLSLSLPPSLSASLRSVFLSISLPLSLFSNPIIIFFVTSNDTGNITGHMACGSISDFVVNTASRTFLPVGKTFDINIGSILSLFFKTIFPAKLFLRVLQSPQKQLPENIARALCDN